MRRTLMIAAALLFPLTGCESTPHDHGDDHPTSDWHAQEGPYRHVVCFRYKDGVTPAQINEINDAFAELAHQIPTIRHFEWGTNVSPEGLADGFTHCYLVTFDNGADLKAYLTHPAHVAFVEKLRPVLDKPFVIDYVPHHRHD